MIKFFQKLKAKKGFTLVELIVVIAIIGVLAAILVPTMLGYVTSSRVTSADTTAAKIEDSIDTFLTQADTAGYGMLQSNTALALIEGGCANGIWTLNATVSGTPFKSSSSVSWGTAGTGKSANETKVGVGEALDLLAIELANLFPDVETCCFEAQLRGGDCTAVWYTADASTASSVTDLTGGAHISNGEWAEDTFDWDNTTAGVSSNGFIVGTSPKLNLG